MKKKLGIVGYGDFGKLMEKFLADFFEIEIFRRDNLQKLKEEDKLEIEKLQKLDYLVVAVTLNSFAEVCEILAKNISTETIVLDVCSVKVSPVEIMQNYFNKNQIIATHPIFGPQSSAAGLENLKIVVHNVSADLETYNKIKIFLSEKIKLSVIEMTPEKHDNEMAYVQGLSHFIAQTLEKMQIPDSPIATYSYRQLLKLKELIGKDSLDLFKTIENGNPKTKAIRQDFLRELQDLENVLEKDTVV
jgi:prephenate dehydrogenase